MTKEEVNNLFKKYNVRIPNDKHGQSECKKCKEAHKYSLTWTSFLYEYKGHYYCFLHIVNILLEKENKQLKDSINKVLKIIWDSYGVLNKYQIEMLEDILKEHL